MTQKSLGYVELRWTCPNCGSKVPGPQKTCGSCGAPQPANVQFEQVTQAELIKDEKKLEEAKKGADVHCPYCGTRNPADAVTCNQCGGDLKEAQKREAGQVVGAFSTQPKPVQQIPCPNCKTPNPDTRDTCSACGANLHEPVASHPPLDTTAAKPGSNRMLIFLGIGLAVLAVVCIIFLTLNLNRRQDLTATVRDLNWSRIITIQEFRDASYTGWINQVPADAEVGDCEKRQYQTLSSPPVSGDYQEVCGTPYTKDTGSGFGEVVQDCQYVVYQDYCNYTVQEWQVIDQVQIQGDDLNPRWPELNLSTGQRQGNSQEIYKVEFVTNNGSYTYTTSNPDEFSQFALGSEWILVLNGFNQIVGLEAK